jgi:protease I
VGPDVTNSGAEYVNIPVTDAMTEGNLVSAPAWPAHPAWMSQFMKLLGAKIEL